WFPLRRVGHYTCHCRLDVTLSVGSRVVAGTQAVSGSRGDEQSVIIALLDGLLDRMLRSPLMRRAPAQCTAEEQMAQAALLGDLAELRALRASTEALPALRHEQVAAYWPELAAQLAPSKRASSTKTRQSAAQPAAPTLGGLYDNLQAEAGSTPSEQDDPPAASAADVAGDPGSTEGPDLSHLLLEALTVQGRALNTTQMLAWLHERGTIATRTDVMNTLFGHEELFRKRGGGHWVVAGREA
ncbi:MAG: hypothetical protein JWO42_2822, partial [Chloroflexi bacterium]|nr:hypothetical protein [Chloroflexota bacterium]